MLKVEQSIAVVTHRWRSRKQKCVDLDAQVRASTHIRHTHAAGLMIEIAPPSNTHRLNRPNREELEPTDNISNSDGDALPSKIQPRSQALIEVPFALFHEVRLFSLSYYNNTE